MSTPDPEPAAPRWRLGVGQLGAVVVGLTALGVGIVFGRADAMVMGLPLLVLAAWAWDRRPLTASGTPVTDAAPSAAPVAELLGDGAAHRGALGYVLRLETGPGVEAVQVRVRELGGRPRLIVLPASPARPVELRGRVRTPHSGPQRIVTVDWRLVATGGALLSDPGRPLSLDRAVAPSFAPIGALPLPRRLTGMTGAHDSARPGDGGDFHDLDRFRPGDRLRRIDWKATARLARDSGELYVRRTQAQADATVFVMVDSADDLGENADTWAMYEPLESGATSLDLARTAASAIAAGYLRQGDRVALSDLAAPDRLVRPGAGARHRDRLLRSIASIKPSGAERTTRRAPLVVSGAAVFLLSTFLDDHPAAAALQFAASGHRVIAVDVLPPAYVGALTTERLIAHRLLMIERANRLGSLRRGGVDVLAWGLATVDPERDARLLALARPRHSGAAVAR